MERTLKIYEIIQEVVECVDKKSLVSCARVCKLWSDIALGRVWNTVDQPRHLFATAWPDLLPLDKGKKWYSQVAGLDRLDWTNFASYARRVRSFNYDPVYNNPDEEEALFVAQIIQSCPLKTMLPCLQDLDVEILPDKNGSIGYASKLLSPSLRLLSLGLPARRGAKTYSVRPVEIKTLMQAIAHTAPDIANLELPANGIINVTEAQDGVVYLLPRLRHLTDIKIDSATVTPRILTTVAQLPNLVRFEAEDTSEEDGRSTIHRAFMAHIVNRVDALPSLTELMLNIERFDFGTLLRSHRCFQRLRSLELHVADDRAPVDEHLVDLLLSVVAACQDLNELIISQVREYGSGGPVYGSITNAILNPLKELRNLTWLTFSYVAVSSLMDRDVLHLIKDCPQLEQLHIGPNPNWMAEDPWLPTSSLSLNVLVLLSNQVNNLFSLNLCINVTPRDFHDFVSSTGIGNHLQDLDTLGFGCSTIDIDTSHTNCQCLQNIGRVFLRCIGYNCVRSYEDVLGVDLRDMVDDKYWHLARIMSMWDKVWAVLGQ